MVSAVEFVKRLLHELRHRMAPLTYYKFKLPVATWGLVHYPTKGTTMIAYVLLLKKDQNQQPFRYHSQPVESSTTIPQQNLAF